jgi:hypothetical protein
MVAGVAAKPDRQLRADGEQHGQRPIDLQRVKPDATEAGKQLVHDLKVNRAGAPVIDRSADAGPPQDQPIGRRQRSPGQPTPTRRPPPSVGWVSNPERRHHMSGSNRLARLVPLAGVAFAVLTMAGYLTIGPYPDSDASIPELTSFYAAHHSQVAAGGQLLGLAAIFFALFGTAAWARIRASDLHPIVAGTALVATAMAAVSWVDGAGTYSVLGEIGHQPWLAPAALQALQVSGTVGGIDGGTVLFLLAVATAGIAGHVFPRWLAWPALVLAIVYFTPFGFYGSLLFLLWAAVTGIVMAVRPTPSVPATAEVAAPAMGSGPALTSR